MDVEAVATRKGLRVLEIDARIPSQTPAAVEAATGINLLDELVRSRTGDFGTASSKGLCSVYRHVFFRGGVLSTCGEKTFSRVKAPRAAAGLFG